jgi:hypothetical protein
MYKLVLAGGVALLISACASTQPASKTSSAAAANSQSSMIVYKGTAETDQHLICTTSQPLDSHIPQRICMTKAQMEARQKASQEAMQNAQEQSRMSGCGQPVCMRP